MANIIMDDRATSASCATPKSEAANLWECGMTVHFKSRSSATRALPKFEACVESGPFANFREIGLR